MGPRHVAGRMVRRCLLLVIVGALLLLAGGCGGGTTTVIEKTVTVEATPTTPTTVTTATTPTTGGAPTSASERCPDVPDVGPTGSDPADAGNVTMVYTDCATATRLAQRFYGVWIPSGKAPGEFVTVDGFRCGELRDTGGFTARIVCSHSASEVRFDLL